jgi:hypothetical protein
MSHAAASGEAFYVDVAQSASRSFDMRGAMPDGVREQLPNAIGITSFEGQTTRPAATPIQNTARPSWPDVDIRPDSDPAPLLENGAIVDIAITGAKIRTAFKGRRFLEMHCEVLDSGERKFMTMPDGKKVPMVLPWYLPLPEEKAGRRRRFRVAKATKFYRAWVMANGGRKPLRRDQMALSVFGDRMLRVAVRTVKTTSQGSAIPDYLWHSVVDDVAP